MQHAEPDWYFGPDVSLRKRVRSGTSPTTTLVYKARLDDAFEAFVAILHKKGRTFGFLEEVALGDVLLVGEGNLSFALALARQSGPYTRRIFATTFERAQSLQSEARRNASYLRALGAQVAHGVDATKLEASLGYRRFRLVVFQFPNLNSRSPLYGRNPNHIVVRRFLRAALQHLDQDGRIAVTIVNSPYYLGAFNLPDAARSAGYQEPEVFSFNPKDFPGYRHVNTAGAESALSHYRSFSTWIFRPEQAVTKCWPQNLDEGTAWQICRKAHFLSRTS